MPNKTVPAAANGLPNSGRRQALKQAGLALAVASASPSIAAASPAPKLFNLIKLHRRAEAAFKQALRHENEAFDRFNAQCEAFDFEGVAFDAFNPERTRKLLLDVLEIEKRREFGVLKIGCSAAMRARLDDFFEELRRDKIEHFDAILLKVNDMRAGVGLTAAEEASGAACSHENEVFVRLCAWPCVSLDEIRIKAEYLLTAGVDIEEHRLESLLRSLAGQPPA